MGKSVLTLDTIEPDRDFLTINEKPYFLRGDMELSLTQVARIRRLSLEFAELKGETSEEEVLKIEGHMQEILDMIVIGLPAEVRDKLTLRQKTEIVRVFTTASNMRRQAEAEKGSKSTTDG